jgi:hypothetical protein
MTIGAGRLEREASVVSFFHVVSRVCPRDLLKMTETVRDQ